MRQTPACPPAGAAPAEAAPAAEAAAPAPVAAPVVTAVEGEKAAVSPRAKKLAERAGVDASLATPTGPNGRIIERDIEKLISERQEPFVDLLNVIVVRIYLSRSIHTSIAPSLIEQTLTEDLTGYAHRRSGKSSRAEQTCPAEKAPGFAQWALQKSSDAAGECINVFLSKEEDTLEELETRLRGTGRSRRTKQNMPAILVRPVIRDGKGELKVCMIV